MSRGLPYWLPRFRHPPYQHSLGQPVLVIQVAISQHVFHQSEASNFPLDFSDFGERLPQLAAFVFSVARGPAFALGLLALKSLAERFADCLRLTFSCQFSEFS